MLPTISPQEVLHFQMRFFSPGVTMLQTINTHSDTARPLFISVQNQFSVNLIPRVFLCERTLGQKPTFYPEIPLILMFQKCEFCEKYDFRNVNFVKNEILER